MAFSENISRLQEERGISNYRIAKDLRISQTTVQNWRTGATKPTRAYVGLLANYFGVTEEQLTGEENTA